MSGQTLGVRRSSAVAYWTPAVALILWFAVLTPAVGLLWLRHISNPPDDVDWVPLSWPTVATVLWTVVLAMIVVGLRWTRR